MCHIEQWTKYSFTHQYPGGEEDASKILFCRIEENKARQKWKRLFNKHCASIEFAMINSREELSRSPICPDQDPILMGMARCHEMFLDELLNTIEYTMKITMFDLQRMLRYIVPSLDLEPKSFGITRIISMLTKIPANKHGANLAIRIVRCILKETGINLKHFVEMVTSKDGRLAYTGLNTTYLHYTTDFQRNIRDSPIIKVVLKNLGVAELSEPTSAAYTKPCVVSSLFDFCGKSIIHNLKDSNIYDPHLKIGLPSLIMDDLCIKDWADTY